MKRYSREEAAALLPEVIPVLEAMRAAFLDLRAIQATVAAQGRSASGDGHGLADPFEDGDGKARLAELNHSLRLAAARLDGWGIEVKDPGAGLIDFFHEREGRTVYLCFRLGESAIGFWHELDAGFQGRQPL